MSLLENLEESAVLIKQDGKEIIIKAERTSYWNLWIGFRQKIPANF